MSNYSAPPTDLVAATFARLDAVDEPTLRAILDLHQRHPLGSGWECQGCDAQGYEVDETSWPCRTIEVIIETHLGVRLSTTGRPRQQWGLVPRPPDGSLDRTQ